MVSGTYYFIAEDDLFTSQPIASLDHSSDGVDGINGNYNEGRKVASLTLSVEMARWAAPPGSVVLIRKMGPWNGRWLVNDVERSAFSETGSITLKKPLPRLPEPGGTNVQNLGQPGWGAPPTATLPGAGQYQVASALIQPIPDGASTGATGGHPDGKGHNYGGPTSGLAGYPAGDFFCKPGTKVLAVESGKIERFAGSPPSQGPTQGPGGPLGYSIYLTGDSGTSYFLTHLETRTCHVGQKVSAGEVLGTVTNYDKYGVTSHVHVGVHPGKLAHPNIYDLVAAPFAVNPNVPNDPKSATARAAAQKLLPLISANWVNAHQDIIDTAAGKTVFSPPTKDNPRGIRITMDPRVFDFLFALHEADLFTSINLSALCSDHNSYDSMKGHHGGHAFDINILNGTRIDTNSSDAKTETIKLTRFMNAQSGYLDVRQIISGGYGNHRDSDCTAQSKPGGDSFYGSGTMAQHCNHVHGGF
jgi:murein DD-endopeptidase MepM/ murein hydrolase activator NlpD